MEKTNENPTVGVENFRPTNEAERTEFEQWRAEKAKKEAEENAQNEREAYKELVNETVEKSLPILEALSKNIAETKQHIYEDFRTILDLKAKIYGVKEKQSSHTFTNENGDIRVMLGNYQTDGWRDTVNEGILIVKEVINSLAKDEESAALVNTILKLLSKDKSGNLKASKVLELSELADKISNDRLKLGVKIIRESWQPEISKQFVRIQKKNENNQWKDVPLGMTEA